MYWKSWFFFPPLIFNDVRCVPLERSYQFLIKCFRSIHLDNTPHTHACTSGPMWAQRPLTRTMCHLILFPSASCLVVKQNILLVQRQMSVTDGNLDNFRKVLKGYIDATSAHSDNLQWVCCVFSGNARYLCKHCQSLLLGSRFDHRGNVESAVWIFSTVPKLMSVNKLLSLKSLLWHSTLYHPGILYQLLCDTKLWAAWLNITILIITEYFLKVMLLYGKL